MSKAITELCSSLATSFSMSQHRLDFSTRFILGLISTKTVNLTQIALALNPRVKSASNYRRIQRFLAEFSFDKRALARWVLAQLPDEALLLCLDRTNWKFGALNINVMALGVAYRGTAFGLMWSLLAKFGNSNQQERINLMKRLLSVLPKTRIKALVADREFIGQDWFAFLIEQGITFHIRLRRNMLSEFEGTEKHLHLFFSKLAVGQSLTLRKRRRIGDQKLWVTGLKLEGDELLIIVTNGNPKNSLDFYAQRWEIEMLFSALKTTGFDLEATHLNKLARIDTLLALVMLAALWAHRVGERLHDDVKPIPVKNHGRLAQSLFRYGLDYLRSIVLHLHAKLRDFCWCLQALSCT